MPPLPPPGRWLTPLRLLQAALVLVSLVALGVLLSRQPVPLGVEVERRAPVPGIDEIRVHVGGEVRTPGVVIAQPGERVSDAIARAGGVTPEADVAAINLARRVQDEDRIVVPKIGTGASRLLDLNRATQAQLEALPGIGAVRAAAILADRTRTPFRSTDELLDRGLVSASVYAQVRDLVTVSAGER